MQRVWLGLMVMVAGASCGRAPAPAEETPEGTPKPGIVDIPEVAFLEVIHINVGQGDSTLVVGPTGRTLLIDGGDNGMGTDRVIKTLQERSITGLDYVVATHPHADHIGGLDEVLTLSDATGGVWDNGDSANTQAFDRYSDAAAMTTGGRHTIQPGHVFDLGDGATATCYAANGVMIDGWEVYDATSTNDRSVVLVIEWGAFREVIAGDLGGYDTETIADVESSLGFLIGDVDVLKASHHGSR